MSHAGVIEVILGAGFPARLERLAEIAAAQGAPVDPMLRLIAFATLTVEDGERLGERLRLSNRERERAIQAVALLERLHGATEPGDAFELTRLLYERGRVPLCDALALAQADSAAPPDAADWRQAADFAATTPAPAFPVRGADLVARGLRPGKALGAALKALQAKWIRAGFPRDPAIVKRLVDEAVAATAPNDDP